jgi:hypothetical protein
MRLYRSIRNGHSDVWPSSLQELLEFVASYHMLLDPINLVTCLYRLAKMSKESSRGRAGFLAELQRSSTFQLLLRKYNLQVADCCCISVACS